MFVIFFKKTNDFNAYKECLQYEKEFIQPQDFINTRIAFWSLSFWRNNLKKSYELKMNKTVAS